MIGKETGGEYTSYHFDYRGSTVALTDKTGQVIEIFQYSPYGLLISGDASTTPFLFNGKYGVMTDDNGLYYMRARFYSPSIRRFVNQDILLGRIAEGQTLNRYAFVTGRPVSYIDPFGLFSLICLDEVWLPFAWSEEKCENLQNFTENQRKIMALYQEASDGNREPLKLSLQSGKVKEIANILLYGCYTNLREIPGARSMCLTHERKHWSQLIPLTLVIFLNPSERINVRILMEIEAYEAGIIQGEEIYGMHCK